MKLLEIISMGFDVNISATGQIVAFFRYWRKSAIHTLQENLSLS
jgi:hypothetical protein